MGPAEIKERLQGQIEGAVRRLLSAQDRDPFSASLGCFDRRYWAWKLTDLPEATYQRNVYPMALIYDDPHSPYYRDPLIRDCVHAGLSYAASIQHDEGSFDQAYPNERSFGATAFLLHDMLEALRITGTEMDPKPRAAVENALKRAAGFLCTHQEKHGYISNHVGGAVLSLLAAAEYFGDQRFKKRAMRMLERLLECQSQEGWFIEYHGADPGYQTLTIYYLSLVLERTGSAALREAIARAVDFTACFVHPDGTFAGEYGSRRTAVFYPGGFVNLTAEFPSASAIAFAMLSAAVDGSTTCLLDVDFGNVAPLLSNYLLALKRLPSLERHKGGILPWELTAIQRDYPEAGIHIRGTSSYYAIVGVSNGGILKVFDKRRRRILWDDGGYIGRISKGPAITTQMTMLGRGCSISKEQITLRSHFYRIPTLRPTPLRFVIGRCLALTILRFNPANQLFKRALIQRLMKGRRYHGMELHRKVIFGPDKVMVRDRLINKTGKRLLWLKGGIRFVAIHGASTRYLEGAQRSGTPEVPGIDVDALNRRGTLDLSMEIGVER